MKMITQYHIVVKKCPPIIAQLCHKIRILRQYRCHAPDAGEWLYIAQMFQAINPHWVFDGSLWALRTGNGQPQGEPIEVADLGDDAGLDGLAQDIFGRIYIACWNAGQVWRYNPANDELVMICQNVPGVASLAFGRGDFDTNALYATSTLMGSVLKISVGIQGAELYR